MGNLLYEFSQEEAILKDEHLATAVYLSAVKHKNSFIKKLAVAHPELLDISQEKEEDASDWQLPLLDDSSWGKVEVSKAWERSEVEDLQQMDGIVWFRKELELSASEASKATTLHLGPIDDSDVTYVNGRRIGGLIQKSAEPRKYRIPKRSFKSRQKCDCHSSRKIRADEEAYMATPIRFFSNLAANKFRSPAPGNTRLKKLPSKTSLLLETANPSWKYF